MLVQCWFWVLKCVAITDNLGAILFSDRWNKSCCSLCCYSVDFEYWNVLLLLTIWEQYLFLIDGTKHSINQFWMLQTLKNLLMFIQTLNWWHRFWIQTTSRFLLGIMKMFSHLSGCKVCTGIIRVLQECNRDIMCPLCRAGSQRWPMKCKLT